MFSHTFKEGDVTVLLERVEPNYLDPTERQQMIAQGIHYNELISKEALPSAAEMVLFREQVIATGNTMAVLVNDLAKLISEVEAEPVLVSLVRAGTPTGILVKRALARMGKEVPHYSVSIVQGRGLDVVAIEHILSQGVNPKQLIFIDGWTGKGVVRRELSAALKALEPQFGEFRDELFVLSDIAGVAEHAITREDVLITSAILSGPLCGLVSRTLYQGTPEEPQMHGAAFLDYMQDADVSQWFIEEMDKRMQAMEIYRWKGCSSASEAQARMANFLSRIQAQFHLKSVNAIKPGIGESTRLFLRKKPRLLLVATTRNDEVAHLLSMAEEKGVEVIVDRNLPFAACTLMQEG